MMLTNCLLVNLKRVFAAIVVMLSLFGCGGHVSAASRPRPSTSASASTSPVVESTSTAEGTVVAYYGRLGRHDIAGAAALLEPHLRQEYLHAGADGDFENTVSIRKIRDLKATVAPSTPGLPAGYRDITQVFLSYDVAFRHVVAASNGPNSRFVYVGRNAEGQRRILEIGTGP